MGSGAIKGNKKGARRLSYQSRRIAILSGIALVLIGSICFAANAFGIINLNQASSKGKVLKSTSTGSAENDQRNLASSTEKEEKKEEEPVVVAEEVVNEVKDEAEDEKPVDSGIDPALAEFPTLKYGTAWKTDRTAGLVKQAIMAGFRHIDTACQPRHYNEAGVGEGWTAAAKELGLKRSDIWIQTKYTNVEGQDPNDIPYDPETTIEERVKQSVAKSLENLQTSYIDSLVMHGPEHEWADTFKVWSTFESFVDQGIVKQLGISNAWDVEFVKYLHNSTRIKPKVVQQRFYGDTKYEVDMRTFCDENGIEFQSFWTLGANRHALRNERVRALAQVKNLSPETLLYAFCLTIGITVLDGTTNQQHMDEDIALLKRFKSGDKVFSDDNEITIMADALGIPNFVAPKL